MTSNGHERGSHPPPPATRPTERDAPLAPGIPPGPTTPPPSNRPRRRAVLVTGGAALAVLAGLGVLSASRLLAGPSFPEGSLVYSDEFDDVESGWDTPLGAEFDPEDDFTLAGYTNDGQYAIRATPDDTRTVAATAFEGETPDQVGISVATTTRATFKHGEMGMACFVNEDDETAYSITIRPDGTGARITREAGEDGSSSLGETNEVSGFATQEEAEPTNILQATCALNEAEGTVTVRFWVNDSLVLEAVDDDPLATGTTALMVQRDGGGSDGDVLVHFDDYRLTGIDTGQEDE